MKHITFFFAAGLLFILASCKPTATGEVAETLPAMEPFNVLLVTHPVKDYNAFVPRYMAHDSFKQAYTMTHWSIGRGIPDSNMVYVFNKFTDMAKVKEFTALPDLKAAMDSAGVAGPPTFDYIRAIRNDTTHRDIKDRVMVKARVKDFNTMLKVYDQEGPATRQAHGMYDRGLGRGVEDTNKVYVIFSVFDMAKAQARMGSEELKKLMSEAGVEGAPEMHWYKIQ